MEMGLLVIINLHISGNAIEDHHSVNLQCNDITQGPYPDTSGGGEFDDIDLANSTHITAILVRYTAVFIRSINVRYGLEWSGAHGDDVEDGSVTVAYIELHPYETIVRVTGNNDDPLKTRITFTTNLNNTYGSYGNTVESDNYDASGAELRYVSGKAGTLIDQISFHFDSECKYKSYPP